MTGTSGLVVRQLRDPLRLGSLEPDTSVGHERTDAATAGSGEGDRVALAAHDQRRCAVDSPGGGACARRSRTQVLIRVVHWRAEQTVGTPGFRELPWDRAGRRRGQVLISVWPVGDVGQPVDVVEVAMRRGPHPGAGDRARPRLEKAGTVAKQVREERVDVAAEADLDLAVRPFVR